MNKDYYERLLEAYTRRLNELKTEYATCTVIPESERPTYRILIAEYEAKIEALNTQL